MRKLVLALGILFAAGGTAMAQTSAGPWSFQFQAGYTSQSEWLDSGLVGSVGVGYTFGDHFALNFHAGYLEGKIRYFGAKDAILTLMVAPEFVFDFAANNQFYAFVGVGSAYRGEKSTNIYYIPSETAFAAEVGVGYRHFFNESVGLSFQITMTHINATGGNLDPVDARLGLAVRF